MIWIGTTIVILTFVAIIKKFETRMVLITSGVLMAIIAGKFSVAEEAFLKAMVNPGLVTVICSVVGFSAVMKWTGCDSHMVHLIIGPLKKAKAAIIPASIIVTALINIALPSAAGCAAAVGSIMIPSLISAGVHPATAASAIMAGTWGGVLSPGASHNVFMAKMLETDVMSIVAIHTKAASIIMLVSALLITAVAVFKKETSGYIDEAMLKEEAAIIKANPIYAAMPVIPLLLLLVSSKQVALLPPIGVPLAMLIGVVLSIIVTRKNPGEITKKFFTGMGEAYGNVIGIIIAAAVFTSGMQAIGLTNALIEAMKNSDSVARLAAGYGPMVIAILSGSGDAATLAFNGAITPHAEHFGMQIGQLGSLAQLSGTIGRTMSPVAGAAIVCAGLAKVNTIEMTKRLAGPMIISATMAMFFLS